MRAGDGSGDKWSVSQSLHFLLSAHTHRQAPSFFLVGAIIAVASLKKGESPDYSRSNFFAPYPHRKRIQLESQLDHTWKLI